MCRGTKNARVPLYPLERDRVVPTNELQRPATEDRPEHRPLRALQQGQPAPDHRGGSMNVNPILDLAARAAMIIGAAVALAVIAVLLTGGV